MTLVKAAQDTANFLEEFFTQDGKIMNNAMPEEVKAYNLAKRLRSALSGRIIIPAGRTSPFQESGAHAPGEVKDIDGVQWVAHSEFHYSTIIDQGSGAAVKIDYWPTTGKWQVDNNRVFDPKTQGYFTSVYDYIMKHCESGP